MPDYKSDPSENEVEVNSPSPIDKLKALQEQLKKLDEQLEAAQKARAEIKAQVDALTPTVTELENAGNAFSKAVASLGPEVTKLTEYHKKKVQMVEAVLGPEKIGKIEDAIKDVNKTIQDAGKEVEAAAEKAKTASNASQVANQDVDVKKKDYDQEKNVPKDLSQTVDKLKAIQEKIEKFDDEQKPAGMFAYLKEMEPLLKETEVVTKSQADYEKGLNEDREKLDAASETALKKKQELEAANDGLKKEEGEHADLEKKRVEDILKKVEPLNA